MKQIKSTNLIAADYDAEKQTCDVQFKNGTYRYHGVTPEKWNAFEATFQSEDSSGRFFNQNIKPLKFEKL